MKSWQHSGLPPDDVSAVEPRIRRIVDFWNELDCSGESGATTWEVLEELRLEVTECLSRDPPDIDLAESLTARAMHSIAGAENL